MKGSWAVLIAATALLGCRTAQPTANPFLRTTVPPPATGQGAVVTPGEPYYPGAPQGVPPMTGAPPGAAPVPLGPPPGAAPMVAPPPVIPQKDKYSPPGGSYQYHQSSIDRSDGDDGTTAGPAAKTELAHASAELSIEELVADGFKLSGSSEAVEQAILLRNEGDPVVAATYEQSQLADARKAAQSASRDDSPPPEPERLTVRSMSSRAIGIENLRAQESDDRAADDPDAEHEDPGAAASGAAERLAVVEPAEPSSSEVAMTSSERDDGSARDVPADEVVQQEANSAEDGAETAIAIVETAGAKSAATSLAAAVGVDYAFTPDYTSLAGRLEYSQSARQWKLRYIPIDGETDSYGGSVVLGGSDRLAAFRPGDQVAVHGSLAGNSSASASFSPLYRLDRIERLVH